MRKMLSTAVLCVKFYTLFFAPSNVTFFGCIKNNKYQEWVEDEGSNLQNISGPLDTLNWLSSRSFWVNNFETEVRLLGTQTNSHQENEVKLKWIIWHPTFRILILPNHPGSNCPFCYFGPSYLTFMVKINLKLCKPGWRVSNQAIGHIMTP